LDAISIIDGRHFGYASYEDCRGPHEGKKK
jgi:hypothetical protein